MEQRRGIRIPLSEAAWRHILDVLWESDSRFRTGSSISTHIGCEECKRIASYLSTKLFAPGPMRADPPPAGWWRWNIKDPVDYARTLQDWTLDKGEALTAERLQIAIEEDSGSPISVEECASILEQLENSKRKEV